MMNWCGGATWLFKATKCPYYLDYIDKNIYHMKKFVKFGWDLKETGINVIVSKVYISVIFFF